MDCLPVELWLQIIAHLDGRAPSEIHRHEPPRLMWFLDNPTSQKPLKTLSLVCKAMRILALPLLFRNVQWAPYICSLRHFTLNPIPLLRFVDKNDLVRHVVSFTLLVSYDEPWDLSDDPYEGLIRPADLDWFWLQLFSVIDPLRVTLVAPPTTLAAVISRVVSLNDSWAFGENYHMFTLSRRTREGANGDPVSHHVPETEKPVHANQAAPSSIGNPVSLTSSIYGRRTSTSVRPRSPPPCVLFTSRRWTSLLLNEGSYTNTYRFQDFEELEPPSLLGAFLGTESYPNNRPLITPSIVDFGYVAVFPPTSHVYTLLENVPVLDRLFLQITPDPDNYIEEDADWENIDKAELWFQRSQTYSLLVRELMADLGQRKIRVFESGDPADRKVWDLTSAWFLRSGLETWKIVEEGLFLRTRTLKDDSAGDANGEAHQNNGSSVSPVNGNMLHQGLMSPYVCSSWKREHFLALLSLLSFHSVLWSSHIFSPSATGKWLIK
ncbi:hypothetical protein GGR57DRAFT_147033 [Xylariaceae sp. FL1272]|nr:hypothetical protein GGR57DRAFT_147033 [Xylariaceae sp. FL1272]